MCDIFKVYETSVWYCLRLKLIPSLINVRIIIGIGSHSLHSNLIPNFHKYAIVIDLN